MTAVIPISQDCPRYCGMKLTILCKCLVFLHAAMLALYLFAGGEWNRGDVYIALIIVLTAFAMSIRDPICLVPMIAVQVTWAFYTMLIMCLALVYRFIWPITDNLEPYFLGGILKLAQRMARANDFWTIILMLLAFFMLAVVSLKAFLDCAFYFWQLSDADTTLPFFIQSNKCINRNRDTNDEPPSYVDVVKENATTTLSSEVPSRV